MRLDTSTVPVVVEPIRPASLAGAVEPRRQSLSAEQAKAQLRGWSKEFDERRAAARGGMGAGIGKLAAGGLAAVAVGFVTSRLFGLLSDRVSSILSADERKAKAAKVGKRLISVAVLVRLAKWLIPLLLKRFLK